MITKLKLFLIFAFITIGQSISYSQVVGTPYILPTNNLKVVNFIYTGGDQQWQVPPGVTEIFVDVEGAQGGTRGSVLGGSGGRVRCKIPVTPGQTLYLTVGGQPTTNVPVYGFGGNGGFHISFSTTQRAMAGGGLSAISTAFPLTQANALVIAAGGGGASGNASFSAAGGGGLIGGSITGDYGGVLIGGRGGTQSAGGAAGAPYDPNSTAPTAGTALNGGNGGIVNPGAGLTGWNGGGGGGAGYFGGGGGAGGGNAQAGGGGGSSFINSSYVTVGSINMANQNNKGNGVINIYY
jgi:hypothetical protein